MGLDSIPGLLNQILTEGLWKEVYIEDFGEIVTYDKFNDFVTTAPPHGLGSSINTLVKLCPDHPEIISMIDEEIKRTKGGANNPKGVGGWNQRTINDIETDNLVNRYNVPIDKIGESPGGNSKQKGLRRLISEINKAKSPERREKIKALQQQVFNNEISVHKALIIIGARRETFTIPVEPKSAARSIKKRFAPDQIAQLITLLQD
jgi:hypothetical protein